MRKPLISKLSVITTVIVAMILTPVALANLPVNVVQPTFSSLTIGAIPGAAGSLLGLNQSVNINSTLPDTTVTLGPRTATGTTGIAFFDIGNNAQIFSKVSVPINRNPNGVVIPRIVTSQLAPYDGDTIEIDGHADVFDNLKVSGNLQGASYITGSLTENGSKDIKLGGGIIRNDLSDELKIDDHLELGGSLVGSGQGIFLDSNLSLASTKTLGADEPTKNLVFDKDLDIHGRIRNLDGTVNNGNVKIDKMLNVIGDNFRFSQTSWAQGLGMYVQGNLNASSVGGNIRVSDNSKTIGRFFDVRVRDDDTYSLNNVRIVGDTRTVNATCPTGTYVSHCSGYTSPGDGGNRWYLWLHDGSNKSIDSCTSKFKYKETFGPGGQAGTGGTPILPNGFTIIESTAHCFDPKGQQGNLEISL